MISKLHIQNYAIIDEIEIGFTNGLNIITGETGAGKSILMGALNLILGQRADSSVLRNADKKCVIEGTFGIKNDEQIKTFFSKNDLDNENEIVVRREISSNGKSRSFINDTPVNLSQIKELSLFLVDLHQQFDTLEINSENFQREVIDAIAGNQDNVVKLKEQFEVYSHIKEELSALKSQQEIAGKELDYNKFLFEELDELSFQENELENIEAELKLLNNAEQIKHELVSVYSQLSTSEDPVLNQLKSLRNKIALLKDIHPEIENLSQRMESAVIEIQDISDELEKIESSINHNPEKLSIINDRLSVGYKLLKKHGVQTTAQLLEIMQILKQKIDGYSNASASIDQLETKQQESYRACVDTADIISKKRKKCIEAFTSSVNQLLVQMGMPNAKIKIDISDASLSAHGKDSIGFLFDANKSNKFEPLGKVASGGELSRLMLSIKSLVARKLELPTLIFDEIDSGISGEAARQVGLIMKELSDSHQIISITHQAQIAAKANTHFFVHKQIKDDKIVTGIRVLNNDERIMAIAQMLSGEKPTAAALENAREMVSN